MVRSLAAALLALLCPAFASITIAEVIYESSYSYDQQGGPGTPDETFAIGPVPQNLSASVTTNVSTLGFDVRTVPSAPTELKAATGLTVNIDQRGTNHTWQSLAMTATAKSSLNDTAFVEGVTGAAGGTIQLTWAVTGISDILLDATGPNSLLVRDLATVALLTSTTPSDAPDLFVNDLADNLGIGTGTNPILESFLPQSNGFQTFFVDWTAGDFIDLRFDLEVTSTLDVFNGDAAGFTARVNADYSNTATLSVVNIFDRAGNLVPNASLVGQGGVVYATAVPEPSVVGLWCVVIGVIGVQRFFSRRAK